MSAPLISCPWCAGEGERPDGSRFCFACRGGRNITIEEALDVGLTEIAHARGLAAAAEIREGIESDPDGEGFDFRAAERGVSPRDYFQDLVEREVRLLEVIIGGIEVSRFIAIERDIFLVIFF